MTGRKSNLNPANSKNGNDEVDEVLFDEDEASSNLGASTVSMSASRSASASASASGSGSGSDEERGERIVFLLYVCPHDISYVEKIQPTWRPHEQQINGQT